MPETRMCIICGEGFAVTTEGTCGMCDELFVPRPVELFDPRPAVPKVPDGTLIKMAVLVLLLWMAPILAAGAIASM